MEINLRARPQVDTFPIIRINLVMAIDLLGLMGTFGDKGNELRDGKLSVGKDIFKAN